MSCPFLQDSVGAIAPEFGLNVLETHANLETDTQAELGLSPKHEKEKRKPLGEISNNLGCDEIEPSKPSKHPMLQLGDRLFENQVGHDDDLGNRLEDCGEEIRDGAFQISLIASDGIPSSPKVALKPIGRESFPSPCSPPTSPTGRCHDSGSVQSRLSGGSSRLSGASSRLSGGSSFGRVSYGSSSHMSRSPGLDSAPSPGPNYTIEEKIGQGGYGTVHKVRDLRTDRLHAMKLSRKKSSALREIQLMHAVENPHVIGCYEVVHERNIVMDLMDSDLEKVISDKSITLAEIHVKGIAIQIMRGIAAIHQQGYMHRDITPSNVLVNSKTGIVKLSDFGIARALGCDDRRLTPVCTAYAYRSPEGLHGDRSYTQAVDVWSSGCVIAEMLERKQLFPGRSDLDMLERVLQGLGKPKAKTFQQLWLVRAKKTAWARVCRSPWLVQVVEGSSAIARLVPSASPNGRCLLHRLLQLDPSQRPSAEQALSHAFFDSVTLDKLDPSSLPFVQRVAERLEF